MSSATHTPGRLPIGERLTGRTGVLSLLLASGLAALIVSGQPWWRAVGAEAASGGQSVAFSGTDATGGLSQALPVVVLTGTLLTLVLAARGRRVLAVLLGCAGLGVVIVGAVRTPPSATAIRTRFRQISLVEQYALDGTGWPWLYALSGLLILAGAVLLWLGAPRWRARGRRFERRARPVGADADPSETWRALDLGLDPTLLESDSSPGADPSPDEAEPAVSDDTRPAQTHPDVQIGVPTDTMAEDRSPDGSTDPDLRAGRAPVRRNEDP